MNEYGTNDSKTNNKKNNDNNSDNNNNNNNNNINNNKSSHDDQIFTLQNPNWFASCSAVVGSHSKRNAIILPHRSTDASDLSLQMSVQLLILKVQWRLCRSCRTWTCFKTVWIITPIFS